MRHRKSGRKLGRSASHRTAMFRNMVTSLLDVEKIQTTDARAKELRRLAERLITLARRNSQSVVERAETAEEQTRLRSKRVAAVRQAAKVIHGRDVLKKLFGEIAERYVERPGGYTRIVKVGRRNGDGAEMSIIELVVDAEPEQEVISDPEEEAPVAETA